MLNFVNLTHFKIWDVRSTFIQRLKFSNCIWLHGNFDSTESSSHTHNTTHAIEISKPFVAREESGSSWWGKHDESHINITKNRKFVSFLDESIPPLGESDLPIGCVLNLFDRKLHSPHISPVLTINKKPIR